MHRDKFVIILMLLFPSPLWFRGKHTSGATGPSSGSRVWGEAGWVWVSPRRSSSTGCLLPTRLPGLLSLSRAVKRHLELWWLIHTGHRNPRKLPFKQKRSDFWTLLSHFLGELSRLFNCTTLFPAHSNLLCSDPHLPANSTHSSGCWAHHSQASDFTVWALILSSTGCPYPCPSTTKSYKYNNLTSRRLFFSTPWHTGIESQL